MKEPDGLYEKYRVFKEPEYVDEHPTPIQARYYHSLSQSITLAKEVQAFVFVLKPDSDPHAVTALAAYAMAIRDDKPQLATDLMRVVEEYR